MTDIQYLSGQSLETHFFLFPFFLLSANNGGYYGNVATGGIQGSAAISDIYDMGREESNNGHSPGV